MLSRQVMPAARMNNPVRNRPVGADVRRRNEPERTGGDKRESDDDAAFVSESPCKQSGRDRHEKVGKVVCELRKPGLKLADLHRVLEVLVQDVDHRVAETPEEEQ